MGERTGLLQNVLFAADRILDASQPPEVRVLSRGGFLVRMRACTAKVSFLEWEVPDRAVAEQAEHAHASGKRVGVEYGVLMIWSGGLETTIGPGESVWISPGTPHRMAAAGHARGWAIIEPPDPALCEVLGCQHG